MNQEQAKLFLPIIQALADGKTIQIKSRRKNKDEWTNIDEPLFTEEAKYYRVKPEPVTMYANQYKDGFGQLWPSKEKAIEMALSKIIKRQAVKFIEVLED